MFDTETKEAVAKLEAALAFDVDPDTSEPLTPNRKAEIETLLSILRGDPESDDEADAIRSLLGTGGVQVPDVAGTLDPEEQAALDSFHAGDGGVAQTPTAPASELDEIRAAIAALAAGQGAPAAPAAPQSITLEDVLKALDPRDSDAALALFGWLWDNGRFGVIGQLNGGGYMLHYQEPKGTTQAGYIAGGTQGSRMVDAAVEKAKEAGAVAVKRGICEKCFSGVREQEDGSVVLDDPDDLNPTCSAGGTHILHV